MQLCLFPRWLVTLSIPALAMPAASAQISFSEVSFSAGIQRETLETNSDHTGGIAAIDLNNDLADDLFVTNGKDFLPQLYLNDGDGTFTRRDDLLPTLPNVEFSGVVFGDYDNDGDSDLFLFTENGDQFSLMTANDPDGPTNLLLSNQFMENGGQLPTQGPVFLDVSSAAGVLDEAVPPLGLQPGMRAMTGALLDYDRDGFLDLYVGHMVLQAPGCACNRARLYHNNGDGTFQDVTLAAGIDLVDPTTYRPALASTAAHLDNDLWPDLWIVNVHEVQPYEEDFLFLNNGDGTFLWGNSLSPGVGDDSGSGMGVDVADVDHDGNWDLFISDKVDASNDSSGGCVFYRGRGNGLFHENDSLARGIFGASAWAADFLDADNDTWEDLYVGTTAGTDFFAQNNGDGTFTDVSLAAGFGSRPAGIRGSSTADFDRDGDLDIATWWNSGPKMLLWRNDTAPAGNWAQFKLHGIDSNRDAIGAVVKAELGSTTLVRQIVGGSSAHSQGSLVVHFGLGSATVIDRLLVFWPSGRVDERRNVAVNQLHEIDERGPFRKELPPGPRGGAQSWK